MSAKNTTRSGNGPESQPNAERRRKREEFVRNMCDSRTAREAGAGSPSLPKSDTPQPAASAERRAFGSSAKTNARRSEDRRDHQVRESVDWHLALTRHTEAC